MDFVDIPTGTLIMGDNRLTDSSPQHRVQIDSFRIGKFPVSNAEFGLFVDAGGYEAEQYWTAMGWKALQARPHSAPAYWNDPAFNSPRHPVVGVTWYEAVAFCNWWGSREDCSCTLPSEAEWEYAARGPESNRNFPWGDKFELGRANTAEAGFGATTPVDHFTKGCSPLGVWDLSGNVFEWTRSKWGVNWQDLQYTYPHRSTDGREELTGSGARVMRGGSWFNPYHEALCAFRSRYLAGSRGSNIGFRVMIGGL